MAAARLRYRDYGLFWTGGLLSALGGQFTTVAMAWRIYQLTNSALQVGLVGLARALPRIALSLFGGVLADAVDRRRLDLRRAAEEGEASAARARGSR
ncbi:MAG: hypothetical protein EXR64_03120 [Dehalococcoidia bacterium]|nr:hypothetical protein [Dehalococcoidia bacterium]